MKDTMLVPFDSGKANFAQMKYVVDRGALLASYSKELASTVPNKAAAAVDLCTESTGADGVTVAAASDDDDGDGEGDPDSDRRKLPLHSATLRKALDRKRVTESTRIIRMAELKTRIGLSRSTIYELIKSGNFPSSVSLGARAVGWLSSDLDSWLESRIASRNA